MTVKIAVIKLGCIGIAPLLEAILDERADRDDLEVRGFTSGSKMGADEANAVVPVAINYGPQLAIVVSPNAKLPGPSRARELLAEASIPTISISDGPAAKAFYKKNEEGKKVPVEIPNQGFIVLPVDSMIGARREFLDPAEMIAFNADLMKVLAYCGYVTFVQIELSKVIEAIKKGETPELPKVKVSPAKAAKAAGFTNPYALSKAIAAATIAEGVADVTTKGCFMTKEKKKYIPLVSAGHEMMSAAARLAEDSREIAKADDSVTRIAHNPDGSLREKKSLSKEM